MDGETFPSAVDGPGAALNGGDDEVMVLAPGLGDMDGLDSFVFSGVGADLGGGNVTGEDKNGPGW